MKRYVFPVLVLLAACQTQQQPVVVTTPVTAPAQEAVQPPATPVSADTVAGIPAVMRIDGREYLVTPVGQEEFESVPELEQSEDEAQHLEEAGDRVTRVADSLFFKLDNGKTLKLANNPCDCEELADYLFHSYIPALKSWLVYQGGYEWFTFVLVGKRNGDTTQILGPPQVSPDGKKFIVSNHDLVAGFTDNAYAVYAVNGDQFRETDRVYPEHIGSGVIKWKNATTLYARLFTADSTMNLQEHLVRLQLR
ncbi:hypothetical protein ACWKWU_02125 [Chitinophaga lutea]